MKGVDVDTESPHFAVDVDHGWWVLPQIWWIFWQGTEDLRFPRNDMYDRHLFQILWRLDRLGSSQSEDLILGNVIVITLWLFNIDDPSMVTITFP